MEKKGWKITAIIFIILFVVISLIFIALINYSLNVIEDENECSINICSEYESFYFDYSTNVCYCYNDKEIVYQEFIK